MMKLNVSAIRFGCIGFMSVLLLCVIYTVPVSSATVDEAEAIAVADMWYARELNSAHLKLDVQARAERIDAMAARQVSYLDENGDLVKNWKDDVTIHAYIFTYEPSGYVIISADDEILPIVAFDAMTVFRWDEPEKNFLRSFLQKNTRNRWQHMQQKRMSQAQTGDQGKAVLHPMWEQLRAKLAEPGPMDGEPADGAPGDTLQWNTPLWSQGTYYNTTVVAMTGGDPSVPTGCTATAMAIKMRYHSWPPSGDGSNSYTDSVSGVDYDHGVNFSYLSYDWSSMPTYNLTSPSEDVANLMYVCGVAVDMNYEPGLSGAWLTRTAMDFYFRYRGTVDNRSDHEVHMRDSILAGLPTILSSDTHTVVADGYRDDISPYFHINAGWGGSASGWYNLDQVPGSDPTVDRSYPYSSPGYSVYTDDSWSGDEFGTLANPYNTISEGYNATPTSGQLWIRSGIYDGTGNTPVIMTKAMTFHPYRGPVIIR